MDGTTISTLSRINFNQLLESQEDTKKMITFEEQNPSAHAYQKGNYIIYNNNLYKVTAAIAIGDTLSTSTNLEVVNVGEELKATSGGGSAGGEVITPPALITSSFIYDRTEKQITFSGFDEDTMLVFWDKATSGGNYTATVVLKNYNNTWSDTNDNAPRFYPWSITYPSWSEGTDAEIVTLIASADAGEIDLYDDVGWRVGDTRTVHLSAMSAYGGYIKDTHVEQDVEFVLMHHGQMELVEATESGRTTCSFVVGMKDCLANGTTLEAGMIDYPVIDTSSWGWSLCARRNWCNTIFKSAIPSSLLPIFKQFKHYVASKSGYNSGTPTLIECKEYFALPCAANIGGSTYNAVAIENGANFMFEGWSIIGRVKHRGPNGTTCPWWTSSVKSYDQSVWVSVEATGSLRFAGYNSTSEIGIAPYGVI